ncbi:MAG: thioredoxin family protein [Candidatus Bathyarchaeota archaeon]|jgi:thiol-disulfide isomerase/thioredoxin|nr:thioredoxin family protein [Candidatus Bathyarchaeota archaeon]
MIEVDNAQGLNAELKRNRRVLVLFYASWCPYCMSFVPVFGNHVSGFSKGTVLHVLLDDYDNPLWDDYSIGAVPTIILFEDGKVLSRLDGKLGAGLNEKQFKTWLNQNKIL